MKRTMTSKLIAFGLATALAFGSLVGVAPSENKAYAASTSVVYRTHVQKKGWLTPVKNGKTSGTSGQSLRLEAFNLKLEGKEYEGSIEYQAYCQTYGWTGWKKDYELAGTSGEGKRMEAIQIKLTGEIAKHYDIYYRVHAQSYGWLGWAKNGESAGTEGYAYRLEGIEIRLVDKGGAAPGSTANAFSKYVAPAPTPGATFKGMHVAKMPKTCDGGYIDWEETNRTGSITMVTINYVPPANFVDTNCSGNNPYPLLQWTSRRYKNETNETTVGYYFTLDSNGCASIEDENKMGGEFISVYGYNWDSTFLKVGTYNGQDVYFEYYFLKP